MSPNQSTVCRPKSAGSPTSFKKRASHRQSKPSPDVPKNTTPSGIRSTGWTCTSRRPPAVASTRCHEERAAPREGGSYAPDQEDKRRVERAGERAAEQERQVQGKGGEERTGEDPEEAVEVVRLLAAQVHPAEVSPAELVRDPGLQGPANEGVAEAPD